MSGYQLRARKCTCGEVLRIQVQLDDATGELLMIQCLDRVFMPHVPGYRGRRRRHGWQHRYLVCGNCNKRRQWRTFTPVGS
jgi:hypothetical protein